MGFGPLPGAPDSAVVLVEGPWTHRTVRANGIALHVAELGTGPLVLLLHGFPQFWWGWHQQLIDLADAGYRAVAVDLRGYGASDKPPRGYDTPTLAADMAALVTSLGEADAMIVGNDVGGTLAWSIAARHPRVVRSIVVLGAAHPLRMRAALRPGAGAAQRHASAYALRTFQVPRRAENLISSDSRWVRRLYDRWTGPRWRGTPGYVADVERYAEAMRIHPVSFCAAEHFRWMLRSVFRADGRRYASSMRQPITAPVLHLHGDFDTCVLPATAQGSGQYVTGPYEWRVLDGVGHFPHNEIPEFVSGELIRWAKQH
ncbi:MAG TPA: alpha/beta hydrolase [Jatrophihabitans sp.]|uniref:alpha/beta fold hydrolase n=1 Tax=Jatrophihabitans sp. TaxID=1932789 RepID=UPI002E0AAE8D|nr:alpha/beta hydrolase [Jatrophihabitans sp.]